MVRRIAWATTAALLAALASVIAGCGYSSGFIRGADNVNQHQYVMQVTSPPRFVRTVSGSASIGSILCVIPIESGLYQQAMESLHAQKLDPYEILDNLREDTQVSCFLVYGSQKLIVSADVYEIAHATPPTAPAPPTPATTRPLDQTPPLLFH